MKLFKSQLSSIMLFISVLSFGQNDTLKTASIDLIPHWKKDEVHSVIIKSTTTDKLKEKTVSYLTTYNANFKVLEKNESEYLIEWNYTKSKVAAKEPMADVNILAKLLNTKIKIRLSNVGKFIELVNVDELRLASNKVIDELIAKETEQNMKFQYNIAKQMIISKQGLEIALLKQIKLYHFSFGYNYYKTDFEKINNIKLPNPLGGEPFQAIEKVKLVNLDLKNSTCKIETTKNVDSEILSKTVMDFLKRNNKNRIKEIENEFGNSSLELTEHSMQELNFEKGILLKTSFKRKMNLGIQNRTILMEINAIE